MKLICSKSNLLHGVNIVSKAVPTRTTMAILECILIDASANEIKLTANDMELGIETKIEGEIAERGIIALDAKIFLRYNLKSSVQMEQGYRGYFPQHQKLPEV
jgi:DNA polymerase III subunit beta